MGPHQYSLDTIRRDVALMMKQVMETVGSVLYERLKKKYIFDPKSGVIEEATPETYVEDTYLTKK